MTSSAEQFPRSKAQFREVSAEFGCEIENDWQFSKTVSTQIIDHIDGLATAKQFDSDPQAYTLQKMAIPHFRGFNVPYLYYYLTPPATQEQDGTLPTLLVVRTPTGSGNEINLLTKSTSLSELVGQRTPGARKEGDAQLKALVKKIRTAYAHIEQHGIQVAQQMQIAIDNRIFTEDENLPEFLNTLPSMLVEMLGPNVQADAQEGAKVLLARKEQAAQKISKEEAARLQKAQERLAREPREQNLRDKFEEALQTHTLPIKQITVQGEFIDSERVNEKNEIIARALLQKRVSEINLDDLVLVSPNRNLFNSGFQEEDKRSSRHGLIYGPDEIKLTLDNEHEIATVAPYLVIQSKENNILRIKNGETNELTEFSPVAGITITQIKKGATDTQANQYQVLFSDSNDNPGIAILERNKMSFFAFRAGLSFLDPRSPDNLRN